MVLLDSQTSAMEAQPPLMRNVERTRRIGSGDPAYCEVHDFLIDEAQLLDEGRLAEWLGLISETIFYWMPVRRTVADDRGSGFDPRMAFLYETYASLELRIGRNVRSANAFAEDPRSRTRRMVTNVVVHATPDESEVAVDSNILLLRNRGDESGFEQISGRREDLVRRTPDGWRLSQRTILVDQVVLGTPNLGIFL